MTLSRPELLTQINLDDLVSSFGWEHHPLLAGILRRLFAAPARKFAQNMLDFDDDIATLGLVEAARKNLQGHYVQDLRVHGKEHTLTQGPALFLSNHPGLVDTLCLFTAINRIDLHIIALNRPFLIALPYTSKRLFFVSEGEADRMRAIRQVSSHLKSGGATLTFPAGEIEPDPALHSDAIDSLATWMDSAGVFIRFAREAKIIPVLVSGVVWDKPLRHPLLLIKRTRREKERLAAALQAYPMLMRDFRPTTAQVQFAQPISVDEIGSTDTDAIHRVVIERMRGLLLNPPKEAGESAL